VKKTLLLQVILCLLVFFSNLSLNAQWARQYGGGTSDHRAYSIQQTSDGGYIVAGSTDSFSAGGRDIWVLKLDSNGDIEWQKTYGGSNRDTARFTQQTSDGGYIVAGFTNSFGVFGGSKLWILKLSSPGDIEWQKTYGGGGAGADSIQQTNDGGYIVAGTTYMSNSFVDFWILKLLSNGDIEWQRTYGGSDHDLAESIQQTTDGGYIVAGHTGSFGAGLYDFWVLKLDSNGDIEWQKTYGGSSFDQLYSIQQTNDEGYIVAGDTMSFGDLIYTDSWILKLSSNGDIEWQKTYGGSRFDQLYSIQQTNDGGYIVAGDTQSFGDLIDKDPWVLKLSSNGDIDWQYTYGESSFDHLYSIQQTSDGGYVTAGMASPLRYDDIIVLKLYSDGDIDPSCGFIAGSNALIVDTSISPENTSVIPQNTDVIPLDTDASPQDTEASVILLCEASQNDGDGDEDSKGGGCFIATAAYGSQLHPHLDILRDFRDKYLTTNNLGTELVNLYYKYSPSVANLILRHKILKVPVQINLFPFVVFSYSMVHLGSVLTGGILLLIFVLPIFLISFLYRDMRRGS
jgi:hypothetical protein